MDSAELLSCGRASTELWGQLGQSAFSFWLAGNAEPASLSWLELSLLRTRWGFGLWKALGPAASQASRKPGRKGGRVDANGSPVSSGPTGASALGPCGVQFMLTGAGLLRTFWELELLKEVRKSGEKFPVHGWLLRVSVFRGPRRGGAWCGKPAFCAWCRQSLVLFFCVRGPVFPAQFTEGTVPYSVSVSGSILWSNWPCAHCEAARANTMTGGPDLSFSFPWIGKIPRPHQAAWSQPINRHPKGNKGNMRESRKAR